MKLTIGNADFELPEGATVTIVIPVLAANRSRKGLLPAPPSSPVEGTDGKYVDVPAEPRRRLSEIRKGTGVGRKACPKCGELSGPRQRECMCGHKFLTAG